MQKYVVTLFDNDTQTFHIYNDGDFVCLCKTDSDTEQKLIENYVQLTPIEHDWRTSTYLARLSFKNLGLGFGSAQTHTIALVARGCREVHGRDGWIKLFSNVSDFEDVYQAYRKKYTETLRAHPQQDVQLCELTMTKAIPSFWDTLK